MRSLALLLGLVGLSTLAAAVTGRVGSEWPLEWMEGGTLEHAVRLVEGKALYGPPSAEFIPYLYPPLAYVPMAAAVALFGPELWAARLVSVLALVGTLALVACTCARRGSGRAAGLAGMGLFAAGYGYTGAFLDLARVDGVFLLLVVAGAERLAAGRSRAALACFVASAFAKQHGVFLLVAASGWLLVHDRRRHTRDVASAWLAAAAIYAALVLATDGWFHDYVVRLPAAHPIAPALLASFFAVDVLLLLPVLVFGVALALRSPAERAGPWPALLVAALVAGALGRAHPGGHDNVRLAAFAMLVLVGVPPLVRVALEAARAHTKGLAAGALALQLAILWQPPTAHRPPPESAPAFAALARALEHCARGGPTGALDHARLASVPMLHTMALSDLRMAGGALAEQGTTALLAWLASPSAPRAIAVGERFPELDRLLAAAYRECLRVPSPPLATGYRPGHLEGGRRWQVVYVRAPVEGVTEPR